MRGMMRLAIMGVPGTSGASANIVTLPQYLAPDGVVMIHDFEGDITWTVQSGNNGVLAVDTDNVFTGTRSLKMTSEVGASGIFITTPYVGSIDFSDAAYVRLRYFVHAGDMPTSFRITLWQGSNYALRQPQPGTSPFEAGRWNTMMIPRASFSTSATPPNWDNPFTRIELRVYAAAEQQASISFDTLEGLPSVKPAVLITFDDGRAAALDGIEYMRSKGIRGTLYIITERPGSEGYLTVAQLQELYAAGWDIGNHTHAHTDLTGRDEAGIAEALQTAKTNLDGWGLTRASTHVAYPYGLYNDTVLSVMETLEMSSGRTVSYVLWGTLPPSDRYLLPGYDIDVDASLATVKSLVAQWVARGVIPILLFHKFSAGAPGQSEWNIDDFKALIDWLIEQQIQPITISQFDALQSGTVQAEQPW